MSSIQKDMSAYAEALGYKGFYPQSRHNAIITGLFSLTLLGAGGYLAWQWFGWELLAVLFLLFWANNISQRGI